jgi:hypothetical protein
VAPSTTWVKGRLLAGFALIAAPLTWGGTGIMTFLCDQQRRVWQRNLGERTTALARKITFFDPGLGWAPINFKNLTGAGRVTGFP